MTHDHQLRESLENFTARMRRDLEAHTRTLGADIAKISADTQDFWRQMIERAVADAKQEADRNLRLQIELTRNEVTREMELQLARERTALQAATLAATEAAAAAALRPVDAATAREARIATLERLLNAVRRIDGAQSLTQILDTLLRAAAAETSRVAILLVENDHARPWAATGFAVDVEPRPVLITESGVLTACVALKQTSFVKPEMRDGQLPPFMQVPLGHTGLLVPLVVGGDAVAMLYADDVGRQEEREDAPVWTDEIDLLVRHAAIRLENITSARTSAVFGA